MSNEKKPSKIKPAGFIGHAAWWVGMVVLGLSFVARIVIRLRNGDVAVADELFWTSGVFLAMAALHQEAE